MRITFKFLKTGLVTACLLVALVGSPARAQSEASLVLSALPVASVAVSGAAAGAVSVAGARPDQRGAWRSWLSVVRCWWSNAPTAH